LRSRAESGTLFPQEQVYELFSQVRVCDAAYVCLL
jgi:hypothetical protein